MLEASLLSVFLIGLLGGGHCVGMCGGIVGAVTMTLPNDKPRLGFVLSYNIGRVLSYTIAGGIAGAVGSAAIYASVAFPMQKVFYGVAAIMLVMLGLYLSGIWHGITYLEKFGALIWRYIQPYSRSFLPVKTYQQGLIVGLLWGWVPCGMVYSVLVAAFATANILHGMLLMLIFGIGTLPILMVMGMAAVKLRALLQNRLVRLGCGLLVITFGLLGLARLFL